MEELKSKVTLSGILSGVSTPINYIPSMYESTIAVKRKNGEFDFIQVVIPNGLLDVIDRSIKWVQVSGLLGSRQLIEYGRRRLRIYVYVSEIKNIEESAVGENQITIFGSIKGMPMIKDLLPSNMVVNLSVSIDRHGNEKIIDCIPCVLWSNVAKSAAFLRDGDTVTICGRMQSRSFFDKKIRLWRIVNEIAVNHFTVIKRKARVRKKNEQGIN